MPPEQLSKEFKAQLMDHKLAAVVPIMIEEIINATSAIESASEKVDAAFENQPVDNPEVFFLLESLLFKAATVSQIFFPTKSVRLQKEHTGFSDDENKELRKAILKSRKARGALFRQAFSRVDPSVDFFRNKPIRDHLAHIDERYDSWFFTERQNPKLIVISQRIIGERSAVMTLPQERMDTFEFFLPTERIFGFWGDEIHIPTLVEHALKIREHGEFLRPIIDLFLTRNLRSPEADMPQSEPGAI